MSTPPYRKPDPPQPSARPPYVTPYQPQQQAPLPGEATQPMQGQPAGGMPPYPQQRPGEIPPYPPYVGPYPAQMPPAARPARRRTPGCVSCLLALALPLAALALLLLAYFFAPLRVDFLLLGIDRVPEGTALGRSDTMILMSVNPLAGSLKMLSIPRDLWVTIPGVGENRINTAHFFAESVTPGSGPAAAAETVEQNFGVRVPYYARLRFDAVLRIVDAMGGVTVNLPQDMAGLPAGEHRLTGEQALAFIRDRKGTDDFFRMEHAQLMLRAITTQMLMPGSWPRLPAVTQAALSSVDTNLPAWQIPRLGLAFLRAAATGAIDARTITREMATPYTTEGGASVLMPNWSLIQPYVDEMFP